MHATFEKNLWILGVEYSVFSSNKTLRSQIDKYFGQNFSGARANKRPDLMLSANYAGEYLLIEFKRPSHALRFADYQQATEYRNDFIPFIDGKIKVMLIGGRRGNDVRHLQNLEPNVEIKVLDEIISRARGQLNWLLDELGAEARA